MIILKDPKQQDFTLSLWKCHSFGKNTVAGQVDLPILLNVKPPNHEHNN